MFSVSVILHSGYSCYLIVITSMTSQPTRLQHKASLSAGNSSSNGHPTLPLLLFVWLSLSTVLSLCLLCVFIAQWFLFSFSPFLSLLFLCLAPSALSFFPISSFHIHPSSVPFLTPTPPSCFFLPFRYCLLFSPSPNAFSSPFFPPFL